MQREKSTTKKVNFKKEHSKALKQNKKEAKGIKKPKEKRNCHQNPFRVQ